MNYSALIDSRRSIREFTDRQICPCKLTEIKEYYHKDCKRLDHSIITALLIMGTEAREELEGAAGYNQFLIGAPSYMVLLSEKHPQARLNAGYMMEDLVLKLEDMGLGTCWITFTDSDAVKKALAIESRLDVAAIVAFGHGKPARRRPRINILSMSNIDVFAKRRYMDPKKNISDLVFLNTWGNRRGVEDHMGFFGDMLWESLYAVSQAPSYLNRQAFGFLMQDNRLTLVATPDAYNTEADGELSLGIAMLHFDAVAESWSSKADWNFAPEAVELPQDHRAVASRHV
jgi:hypothetical protein